MVNVFSVEKKYGISWQLVKIIANVFFSEGFKIVNFCHE